MNYGSDSHAEGNHGGDSGVKPHLDAAKEPEVAAAIDEAVASGAELRELPEVQALLTPGGHCY